MKITTPGTVLSNTTVEGDLELEGAHGARIDNVIVKGNLSIQHSDDTECNVVTMLGTLFNVNKWSLSHSKGNRFIGCNAPNLGRGQTGGDHCFLLWNADGLVMVGNTWDCTVEANAVGDCAEGPCWWFDCPNGLYQDEVVRIHIKRAGGCYAIWRWRADVSVQRGCFGNRFKNYRLSVDGTGGRLLPSSSGTCDADPLTSDRGKAGCWGLWDSSFEGGAFDGSACTGPLDWDFQGGMNGVALVGTTIKVHGAIKQFDIHRSRYQDCTLVGAVQFNDEYGRPLWKPGDMVFCRNNVVGPPVYIAPKLAAIPGGIVYVCPPPPSNVVVPAPITTLATASQIVHAPNHVVYHKLRFTAPTGPVDGYRATIGDHGYAGQHATPMRTQPAPNAPELQPGSAAPEFWIEGRDDITSRVVYVYASNAAGLSAPSNPVLLIAGPQ